VVSARLKATCCTPNNVTSLRPRATFRATASSILGNRVVESTDFSASKGFCTRTTLRRASSEASSQDRKSVVEGTSDAAREHSIARRVSAEQRRAKQSAE